jgi:hypothetical protein
VQYDNALTGEGNVSLRKETFARSFGLLAGGILLAGALTAQSRITCESNNGRRNYCGADTRGGVTLTKQLSSARCSQGRTWGYDGRGIWVDQGCRAEFALRGAGYGSGRPGYGGPGYGGPGYGGRPPGRPDVQIITCSSENGKRNWCGLPNNGQVRLVRQRSGSECRKGYSWGQQPGSIWVDRGCRADFEVRTYR